MPDPDDFAVRHEPRVPLGNGSMMPCYVLTDPLFDPKYKGLSSNSGEFLAITAMPVPHKSVRMGMPTIVMQHVQANGSDKEDALANLAKAVGSILAYVPDVEMVEVSVRVGELPPPLVRTKSAGA